MRPSNCRLIVVATLMSLVGLGQRAFADDGENECLHGRLERGEQTASTQAEAKEFDAITGRDLRNYPPDRVVDYQRMELDMRFERIEDCRFSATERLTFIPVGSGAPGITLDAVGLKIDGVRLDGKTTEHFYDDKRLTMRFDPPLPAGEKHELLIAYVCDHPVDGMIFTPSSPATPDYTAEVHTQGESDTNRHWFACHDFPNERMSTELTVDVPAGYSVSSNGRLVSSQTKGDRCVWHYAQEKPHVSYLVTLVIGKFDVVEIPHPRVPMKVWVPVGLGTEVQQTYGRTGEMIDMFERHFGVAYPWDRYDQLCVKNFGAGGMENTSATSMYPTAILDETSLLDGDLDGLISHELCHQWTGDYITCKSWEHIWLNEGWATYGSALWNEQRYGEDGYLDSIRGSFDVARRDKTSNDLPMCSPVYERPFETFRRPANPYPKGSSILHMLRMMLGDDVFWKGVRLYMSRHGLGVAETSDFRYALEEVSGRSLEWFFDQWCYRPGAPELNVKVQYDGEKRELMVDVDQMQKIDARTPAFRFALPVVARTASGDHTYTIDVTEKTTSFRTTLDGPPSIVAIDPHLNVLKTITEDKPLAMWMAQAQTGEAGGPTIAARHAAIEALGKTDSPETIALLTNLIRDDKVRYTLRQTAVGALSGYGSAQAKDQVLALAKSNIADARVRVSLVEKLRTFDKDKVADLLADVAANDPSYAVRTEAIAGLARLKASEKADVIVQLVDARSQHDQIRNGALRALADLDDERGLDLSMKYSAFGYMDRSRPTAIDCVGKLAKHDKDKAVPFLIALLNDPETRTVNAAGAALADVGDDRAIPPIKALSETSRDPDMRERAAEWLKRLTKTGGAATQADDASRRRRR